MILAHLKAKTKLVLMLGVEYPCEANANPAFNNSHKVFAEHNAMIRKLAKENDRIDYIYYGDFLKGQDGFFINNYHFTPAVYYKVARRMCEIINSSGTVIDTVSENRIAVAELRDKIRYNPIVDFGLAIVKGLLKRR